METTIKGIKKSISWKLTGSFKILVCTNFAFFFFGIISTKSIAQTNIQAARQAGVGQVVTVSGVVTNGPELGSIRYIQDSTAAIGIYSPLLASWMPGDSVSVTGTISEYFGLLEVSAPISGDTVLKIGVALPKPKRIQVSEMGENYEGQLITVKKVFFRAAGFQLVGGSSYVLTNGTDSTNMYIRAVSPLVGVALPSDTLDVTGICSQYTQYQLLPRTVEDWVPYLPDSIVTQTSGNVKSADFFQIFPNPVADAAFSVSVPVGLKNDDFQLEILNSSGRVIFTKKEIKGDVAGIISLDAATLPPGFYSVRISNKFNQFIKKLIRL